MNSLDVCPLEKTQIADASKVAAKAFEDDPVFGYLTSDDRELRFQALTWLTSRALSYCTQHPYVYTTPNLEGIAAWLPPGKFSGHPLQLLRMGLQLQLYALPWQVGWNRLGRWLSFLVATEQAHQQDMGDLPHWYLGIMVVHPASQGKGLGRQLLQPILQRASDEGLPCYLVTFTPQAVGFYQRNGFEIVRHQTFESGAPPFWTLRRDPLKA
ncbi:MAG: GNAT family N-acetyltransferase [Oculatellaceae cyanobacterium Prado106]|nr:GNAT family N-acetyltransferase [Oculatellaceae cyanobacterium Prado106]